MASSIRTFLLVNLLLSLTLIISLAIIGNLFLVHRSIQTGLDVQMARDALILRSTTNLPLDHNQLQLIADHLNKNLGQSNVPTSLNQPNITSQALSTLNTDTLFQVSENGKLLINSSQAPATPLYQNQPSGFSNIWIKGDLWRLYISVDPTNQRAFIMGERSNFREYLENQLTRNSIFVMLAMYPFLILLTWIIVGRGLEPFKAILKMLRNRSPGQLSPMQLTDPLPTEIKPLIDELNTLFVRLTDAFDREKRFAGDAAHELRTPLAALKTQVQVALRATTEADRNKALLRAAEGVDRSAHVIQQLLTLSRMMPDANINEPEILDLNLKAEEIAALLAPAAVHKEIELSLQASKTPALIEANPTSIGILMRNLIDNAIRYTPNGGNVAISLELTATEALFTVQDSGPGIPPELRERVFERFFRVIGNQASGSGLGLGIVKQICRVHGAEVELLTPETGTGLIVRVRFKRFLRR